MTKLQNLSDVTKIVVTVAFMCVMATIAYALMP